MRGFLIKAHLYVATFFAPILVIMAFSGGNYLIGNKGSVESTPITIEGSLDVESSSLEDDVRQLLADNDIDHEFEYLKISGTTLITRPTSRTFYEFKVSDDALTASVNQPDFQKRLLELHMGHGPLIFKDLQKVMAAGLLFVLLTGFGLGVTSPGLRIPTIATAIGGTVAFVLTAYIL